jgi:ankyrin repeat protein
MVGRARIQRTRAVITDGTVTIQDIWEAARTNNLDLLERMNRSHIDIRLHRTRMPLMTPLHIAAEREFVDMARWLLSIGTDRDAQDWNGETPLGYAARNGSVQVARILIEARANVNHRDRDGDTVLSHAIGARKPEIIDILLRAGAEVQDVFEASSEQLASAFDLCEEQKCPDEEIVRMIREYRPEEFMDWWTGRW